MRVVYAAEALTDLESIFSYIAAHCPAISDAFRNRFRAVIARVSIWPESAQEVAERPGVRVVPLIRTPTRSSTGYRTGPWKSFTFVTLRVKKLEQAQAMS
jgi:plasmid stabilization system protein ParE